MPIPTGVTTISNPPVHTANPPLDKMRAKVQELERYCVSLREQLRPVQELRERIRELEAENAELRAELGLTHKR